MEGCPPRYLALPARCAVHSRIQLGMTRVPHRAPQRVADALWEAEGHGSCHGSRHRSIPLAQIQPSGKESTAPAKPQPRAPRSPLPTRDPTHVHVIAEGGVGAVLQPALVAHIVQDARGHQGKVQHLLGWGVIQAQAPAPAGRDRSQQCHPRHPTPPADAGGNSS